jgi:hypothetical protein
MTVGLTLSSFLIRSLESPGFLFWYESQHPEGPRLTYGTNAVKTVGDDKCTAVSSESD